MYGRVRGFQFRCLSKEREYESDPGPSHLFVPHERLTYFLSNENKLRGQKGRHRGV